MKKLFFLGLSLIALNATAQSVAINTDGSTADPSAILDLKSTNQGVLVPRLTQTQRTAIATPATGLMVYQTDATAGFYFYNGTAWTSLNTISQSGIDAITAENDSQNGRLDNVENSVGNISNQNDTQDALLFNLSEEVSAVNTKVLPTGGTANQVLAKVNGADFNTQWVTPAAGGSDNLGNHTATQALNMNNNSITGVNTITSNKLAITKADINITSILNPGTGAILSADIPITNTASFIKITGLPTATAHTLQGFQGGIDGRLLYIYNATLQNINLINNSPNEPNGVKIALLNSAPVTTQAVLYTFIYDASQFSGNGGWVLISVRD